MSDHIGGHKGPINHSLHGPALLLCSIEAWRLVRQCRPCSAFLSINSCFTSSLQLSLTRVQICFQLSVTHSAIQTLFFGIWFFSLALSLFCPLSGSFFPSLLPFCLRSTRSQFNSFSLSQRLKCQSYIISPSHTLFYSGPQSHRGQPLGPATHAGTAALLTGRKAFYPQPEIVDNRWLQPTGHQSIFHEDTCARQSVCVFLYSWDHWMKFCNICGIFVLHAIMWV